MAASIVRDGESVLDEARHEPTLRALAAAGCTAKLPIRNASCNYTRAKYVCCLSDTHIHIIRELDAPFSRRPHRAIGV